MAEAQVVIGQAKGISSLNFNLISNQSQLLKYPAESSRNFQKFRHNTIHKSAKKL
jgi:hypothetical protein